VQELRLQTTIPITTVDQIQITNKTRSKITVLQEEKVVAPLDLIRLAQVIQVIQTAHLDPIRLVQVILVILVILVIQVQVMAEEDLQEVEEEREVKIIQKHLYQ
jgi:hypothetical protein